MRCVATQMPSLKFVLVARLCLLGIAIGCLSGLWKTYAQLYIPVAVQPTAVPLEHNNHEIVTSVLTTHVPSRSTQPVLTLQNGKPSPADHLARHEGKQPSHQTDDLDEISRIAGFVKSKDSPAIFFYNGTKRVHVHSCTPCGKTSDIGNVCERRTFTLQTYPGNVSSWAAVALRSPLIDRPFECSQDIKHQSCDSRIHRCAAVATPYAFVIGGGEAYLLWVVMAMQKLNYFVDIIVFPDNVCLTTRCMREAARMLRIDVDWSLAQAVVAQRSGGLISVQGAPLYNLFLWLGNERIPQVRGLGLVNLYMNQFPFDGNRDIQWHEKQLLQTYHAIIFNSYYTMRYWHTFARDWMTQLHLNSQMLPERSVLYPPVQQISANLRRKRGPNILMMGRLFTGRQSKRQLDAVRVFSKLKHRLLSEHLELKPKLWLVGGQQPGFEDFTTNLKKLALEIGDVYVIPNAKPDQLQDIMANASVVWSMTGFGAAEDDDPADAEHFGIAVTEAMSAGAYPILLNKGGLIEIVCDVHEISASNCTPTVGALASTDEEFVSFTLEALVDVNNQARERRKASKNRAAQFSSDMFVKTFTNLVHGGHFLPFWTDLRRNMHKRSTMVLPAVSSPYVAVIVEMRTDIVLPLVIRNQMLMLGCEWKLHIFHAVGNSYFLRTSLVDIENVKYTVMKQKQLNDSSYNNLFKQAWFWRELGVGTKFALVFQLDSIALKPGISSHLDFDYIGAPWTSDNDIYSGVNEAKVRIPPLRRTQRVGNGGFSLRNVPAMLHVIDMFGRNTTDDEQEDVFFVRWLPVLGYRVAPLHHAAKFALEVPVSDAPAPKDGPLALHQTWAYVEGERLRNYLVSLEERHSHGMVADRRSCIGERRVVR